MQVTIIGGGSYQWGPKLITDLLGTPSLEGLHVVLMDVDPAPLPKMATYLTKAADVLGVKATVATTTDRKEALDGADFVVVTISTGGFASMAVDLDVPAAYGIHQSVGDSVGPGGINRALRNIPVLTGIAHDMEQVCPDAWLLNITNPMTCLTRSVTRETSIKAVGLCHEIGNYCLDVAIAFKKRWEDVHATFTGVNHFPVITALDIAGEDGMAMLAELAEMKIPKEPAEPYSQEDFVQRHQLSLSLLKRWGALPGAGDRHLAEFLPSILTEQSGWGADWGIELTPISVRERHQAEYIVEVDDIIAGGKEMPTWASGEMVAPVIESLTNGTRRELPLNLPNAGQCPDLPADAIVEAMCVVDGDGMRGRAPVSAPAAAAEVLRRHVATQELTVEAAVTGDRRLVHAALALDPLAGRADLRDIDAMAEQLLAGTARWLPQFAG